jgi:hypothetical protein
MVAKSLKHRFQSAQADGGDSSVIRPSNWNDEHDLWFGSRTITTAGALLSSDHLSIITLNAASALAISIAQAGSTGFPSGWGCFLRNVGAGIATVTPASCQINGAATLAMAQNESAALFCDGSNYSAVRAVGPDYLFPMLRFDAGQSLSEAQKTTLRTNAGIALLSQIRGLTGGVTGATTFGITASSIILADVNGTTRLASPGTLNCNISTAGPVAGGRDQAGAFANGSWVNLFYIWNPSGPTTALIASLSASAPTLPSGYAFWSYVGTFPMIGASLALTLIRGRRISYFTAAPVLSGGAQTVETFVSCATYVPTVALDYSVNAIMYPSDAAANVIAALTLRSVSTYNAANLYCGKSTVGQADGSAAEFTLPNMSNNGFYYLLSNSGFTANISVTGYSVPNGGD